MVVPGEDVKAVRRYDMSRREAAAVRRRLRVAESAVSLFLERGYGATTIAAISAHAGVPEQTVFSAFGSKRAILDLVIDTAVAGDADPLPAAARSWHLRSLDDPDPRRRLELHARNCLAIWGRFAPIDAVMVSAAAVDEGIAELRAGHERRRRQNHGMVVESLRRDGHLRRGLGARAATDIVFTLASPEVLRKLIDDCSWTARRCQIWLTDSMASSLLATTIGRTN